MNTFKTFAAALLISASALSGLTSFTSEDLAPVESNRGNISFKIINNTESEWRYCADGGHNTISKGATQTMSFREGVELKYLEKGNCAGNWLKVTSAYNGKTFKLTELMN